MPTGVYRSDSKKRCYIAMVRFEGRLEHLGSFWTVEEAEEAAIRFRDANGLPQPEIRRLAEEPALVLELHPVLNGYVDPFRTARQSNVPLWWLCEEGHEWFVSPNQRITYDTGCPYCAGKASWAFDRFALMLGKKARPLVPYPDNPSIPWPCECMDCGLYITPAPSNVASSSQQSACKYCAWTRHLERRATGDQRAIVYVIPNLKGYNKVGITTNLRNRFRTLQVDGYVPEEARVFLCPTPRHAMLIESIMKKDWGRRALSSSAPHDETGWTETVDNDVLSLAHMLEEVDFAWGKVVGTEVSILSV